MVTLFTLIELVMIDDDDSTACGNITSRVLDKYTIIL